MATLLLRSAGSAVGTILGGPLGGLVGGAIGAVGGAVVDNLLAGALASRRSKAPQLDAINLTSSNEGGPVRKLWGRMRLGGNVIWCTQFDTSVTKQQTPSASGKGTSTTKVTHYQLSFAVAFCEGGDNVSLGRVWADGNELDLSQYGYAFYNGSEGQLPDSWIESVEGTGAVPAYRGICYIVFHEMALDAFGNRMPQITAEIVRSPPMPDPDDATNLLRAVCLLPGAGEFVLGTEVYRSTDGFGSWFPENVHTPNGACDVLASLDQLDAALPNRTAVSLVVSWFGTDLRAGSCQVVPKVETRTKTVTPADWAVAGFSRATAALVSQIDPATLDPTGLGGGVFTSGSVPAFGGTPSDDTVSQAIAEMKRRGLRVMFYPFLMMDIPPGNGLPDPYGGSEQAAFPWRGRITCFPAPGRSGSPDKTAEAAGEVNAFFAQYAPMVLHYASLCAAAGGVDAFVIGSELVGLTQVRSSPGDGLYPAVAALKSLAAQVKAIVGAGCKVGYAADWSEYHSHRPADGSNDVIFNMDPLWSDANIDVVGIDNYLPLSDWRDGSPNLDGDPVAGPFTIYDKTYLASNVEGGEDYAWYYASDADRVAQHRTPIVDAAYAKHWVFRQKDMRGWWSDAHFSRPGGVENASATAFVPQSKPIWFTEFGCPAVDKGPNQPNVFYDPKSSESSLPYFSLGSKDDPVQRAYLETTLAYWRDHAPMSAVYGGPMVDTADMFAWAWDARPYPNFPGLTSVWHDAPNYELGHWLTGRLSEVPLKWIVAELCAAVDLSQYDTSALMSASTLVVGYATDAIASPRDILAGLMDAFQFDACESGGVLAFFARGNVRVTAIATDSLVLEGVADPGYRFTRADDTDLPGAVRITFADPFRGYASASVDGRKALGNSQSVATLSTAAVLDPAYAGDVATSVLQQVWAARETGSVKLPPSFLALDPGDAITMAVDGATIPFRVKAIQSTTYRALDLVGFDPSLLKVSSPPAPSSGIHSPGAFGPPIIEFMPLPPVTGAEPELWAPRIAAFASPWAGIDVYRGNGGGGWDFVTTVDTPAVMGELTSPLYSGPVDRWDKGNVVSARFHGRASLLSLTEAQVLGGAGALAVKNPASGQWEVLQYQNATLVGAGSYTLTKLLRGQLGTEGAMGNPVPAGSRVVFLDATVLVPLDMTIDGRGLVQALRYADRSAGVPGGRPALDRGVGRLGRLGGKGSQHRRLAGRRLGLLRPQQGFCGLRRCRVPAGRVEWCDVDVAARHDGSAGRTRHRHRARSRQSAVGQIERGAVRRATDGGGRHRRRPPDAVQAGGRQHRVVPVPGWLFRPRRDRPLRRRRLPFQGVARRRVLDRSAKNRRLVGERNADGAPSGRRLHGRHPAGGRQRRRRLRVQRTQGRRGRGRRDGRAGSLLQRCLASPVRRCRRGGVRASRADRRRTGPARVQAVQTCSAAESPRPDGGCSAGGCESRIALGGAMKMTTMRTSLSGVAALALCALAGASPGLAAAITTTLTPTWVKIGSAGTSVVVENVSPQSTAVVIGTSTSGAPAGTSGLVLRSYGDRVALALAADLYALAPPGQSNTVAAVVVETGVSTAMPVNPASSGGPCDATLAAGGTAQTLCSGAVPAHGWAVYNPNVADDLWCSDSVTPAVNGLGSIRVFANGGGYETPPGYSPGHAVSCIGPTTGDKITARNW